ncbi:hypothetical protein ACFQZE_20360 [Paenibacillus sp. GCM10027627]|uniref:hypothetical protein n=1 Tax=unclassified Paenibacillus TaxID=185978 RepID=UPI00362B13B8
MKKPNLKISIAAVVAIALLAVYIASLFTSFHEVVGAELEKKEISHISALRVEDLKDLDIEDPQKIARVMESLAGLELIKDVRWDDLSKIDEKYSLTLFVGADAQYGMEVFGDKYIQIYNGNLKGDRLKQYKVRSELDLTAIRDLFK